MAAAHGICERHSGSTRPAKNLHIYVLRRWIQFFVQGFELLNFGFAPKAAVFPDKGRTETEFWMMAIQHGSCRALEWVPMTTTLEKLQ
jgi:hypothetical protein